ncbi:MADS-box transcription factor [Parasponia andersonii]|uniref:MADS-box transcription factor n=1 Tax=Parasponia andersonii TaxID=3476 RepID=A0A2P5DHF1_PARAD|nr:MADS-box transcription factor [Parasponia andersonii]
MGRRKIEIKMVKDSNCRQVTFSKRRTGLFKKANELATLCGTEVGVVVFSPGGKPYSFGQPNVESIADRFLNQDQRKTTTTTNASSSSKRRSKSEAAALEKLNQQLNDCMNQLNDEKLRGEALDKGVADAKGLFLGGNNESKSIQELGKTELEKLKEALEELRERVKERAGEMEASSTLLMLSNAIEPPPKLEDDYVKTKVAKNV